MRTTIMIVVCSAAVLAPSACSIQTIGAPKGDLKLAAVFDDVQGLVIGHSVQISDVRVGTITSIRLEGFRARVNMSIKNGRRIPTGTTATIARTSLLGENYVRLNLPAGRDLRSGPALASGALITETSVQPDLELVTEKAGPLLAALGGQDLGTLINTGAEAFAGQGGKLNRLIVQASQISKTYAAASDDLGLLLDGLGRLGHNLAAGADDLDRLPGSINVAAERLLEDRHRLKKAIQEMTRLAETFNRTIQGRHGARLRATLTRIQAIVAAATRGKEDLKTLANGLLKFLRLPSVSSGGQGMQYVWLAGLLPPRGTAPVAKERPTTAGPPTEGDLNRLLKPPS